MHSKNVIFGSYIFILLVSCFYYPKWNKSGTEATLGWDVSGYYWYLPAVFIYHDIKKLEFSETILKKYGPTPELQQAFPHHSGNRIMKYSCGMALQYVPFFTVANTLAEPMGYEADGFTRPYQVAIQLGGLIMCFIGLWYLRKLLLLYFRDQTVSTVIIIYVLATNYLNYAAIDSALSHNWLFTWYVLLMYASHHFYKNPTFQKALGIGAILGICALTRPTEIIGAIIPILWGVNAIDKEALKGRMQFIITHWTKFLSAVVVCGMVGFIQMAYWKLSGGEWIIYSYSDQGFSWLSPHFKDYLFSYRSGWLLYTPMMLLSFAGVYFLWKRKISPVANTLFFLLNIYIVSSWDIWWYGGRAMIQSYPVLAFPIAALVSVMLASKFWKPVLYIIIGLGIYYNVWWTHQSHRGGMIDPFYMSKEYFWNVAGRYRVHPESKKLIDCNEWHPGRRSDVKLIYENDFNGDSTILKFEKTLDGSVADYIGLQRSFGIKHVFDIPKTDKKWLRVKGDFRTTAKDFNYWRMPQMVIVYRNGADEVKRKFIRLHRFMDSNKNESIHMDTRIPDVPFDKVEVIFWNVESPSETIIDNIRAEIFQ